MSSYTVELGRTRAFTQAEAEHFLRSWYRVAAPDGSTVAYVPDQITAEIIVDALTYCLAMAAARDAGNPAMRKAGRKRWNIDDWSTMAETFERRARELRERYDA